MAVKPKHQTKTQYLSRVREKYRLSTKLETCRLASVILKYLVDGDYNTNDMRQAWNMTPAQWTAKAAALQLKSDKYTAYMSTLNATNNEAGD